MVQSWVESVNQFIDSGWRGENVIVYWRDVELFG